LLSHYSEGQEKYSRELSIAPVEYFTMKNHPVGCPTGTILHGENKGFQSNGSDFPKVTFTLNVRWNLKAYMGALF
jgi:hypothetical protein